MPTKLEQQADLLFANVNGWETSTLERIGRRINKIGKMSVSDIKSLNNIADVQSDMQAITKELAKVTGMNVRQIEKIYADALTDQHLANKPLYDYRNKVFVPFAENTQLQALAQAYAKSTAGTMINLSKTKMLCVRNEKGQFVKFQKGYYDILDKATMQVASGATDFHSAMRGSIKQMGSGGLRVNYGSGVTRRLDTVVRQNLLWGAKQASIAYNELIGEELGCDGIEIDYHAFPRPSHAFMQGKQYVLGNARKCNGIYFESADEALIRLEDYNCYHYKTPIICGISEPRYDKKELAELKERDKRKFDIDGNQMTGYEASQAMRRIETSVREQKGVKAMAQASGDAQTVRVCNERIGAYKEKYAEISDITGIAQDKKRLTLTRVRNSGKIKSAGYTKPKINVDDIPSMDKKRFNKIKTNLEKNGIKVIQDIDGDNFLKAMNAEAMTLSDGSAVIFRSHRVPSASACFEEIIHTTQIRNNGMISGIGTNEAYIEYLRREIEANEKVLRHSKAYGLTELDKSSIQINLNGYKQKLKEVE